MARIYICDGCKKEIDFTEAIHFWGSKILSNIVFCKSCFEAIENYVIDKYKIQQKMKGYGQNRS